MDALEVVMKARFDGRLYIAKSLPHFLEFAAPAVTKAAGLAFVAERLGFAREATVAFGDGENDVELLEWAGYGVAVANAHDRVLAVADFVCPSVDEEGVAQVIEALSRLTGMIDLAQPAPIPRRTAPPSRAAARPSSSTRYSPPTRAGATRARAATRCVRSQKRLGKPSTPEEIEEAKRLKGELQPLDDGLATAERERQELWDRIPNPPHESVPEGEEDDALEVRRSASRRPTRAREHTEIGRFDMERAARVSGSRFGYWIGDTALLALALYRFALDRLVAQGFVPVLPPVLVREAALYGTGWLPSADPNSYKLEGEDLYLAGTAEIPMGGLHADEILEADALPLRYVGFSPCFRSEAGAAGKDTSGMFRVHQFNKVEQFVFTRPEDSWDEHERLLANTEALVAELGVPYRVVVLATGDMSKASAKTYDVELWFPSHGRYRETASGLEHDRLPGAALRHALPLRGDLEPVHMLNGTAVVDRMALAILENFQGDVPDVLQAFGAPSTIS